ncbi:MAG: diguanylate cyclase [Thermoanaerobaculum sp.]|nr:diguanylate cyclase [Thermoanaerobaculum sp.]
MSGVKTPVVPGRLLVLFASVLFWLTPSPSDGPTERRFEDSCHLRVLEVRYSSDPALTAPPAQPTPARLFRAPPSERVAPGNYWLTLVVHNWETRDRTCLLIPDRYAALVELFKPGEGEPAARSGWQLPLRDRAMEYPHPLLPAVVAPGDNYFRLRLWVPEDAPLVTESLGITAMPLERWARDQTRVDHAQGVYGGIMLAVVLYNLFLFFSLREKLYILYVAYATSFGLIWLVLSGFALVFLWPDWPRWDAQAHYVFVALAIVFGNTFTRAFLNLASATPRLARLLQLVSYGAILTLVGVAFHRFSLIQIPLALLALITCTLYLAVGATRWWQKSPEAPYFLAATGLVAVGTLVYIATFLQLLPETPVTRHAAQLGSAAEMVLLAFALGHKIRHLRFEKAEAEARSLTDPLTGLANRRALDQLLDQEWRRAYRQKSSLALIVVDVDFFKAYNDARGHQEGDQLLKLLAEELNKVCRRPGDVASRYGGEEFVLVLPGVNLHQARDMAEKLRSAVEACCWPHPASPVSPYVTVSCGVAVGKPVEGVPVTSLFAEADEALYRAKQNGRNQVHLRSASGQWTGIRPA